MIWYANYYTFHVLRANQLVMTEEVGHRGKCCLPLISSVRRRGSQQRWSEPADNHPPREIVDSVLGSISKRRRRRRTKRRPSFGTLSAGRDLTRRTRCIVSFCATPLGPVPCDLGIANLYMNYNIFPSKILLLKPEHADTFDCFALNHAACERKLWPIYIWTSCLRSGLCT